MPLRFDRRHTDILTWWLKKRGGQIAANAGTDGILEEQDTNDTQFILEEKDAGAGTDVILEEQA